MNETSTASILPDFKSKSAIRHRSLRHVKDVLTRYLMAVGGLGVIIAITLIAFYLFYVVLPLFGSASMERAGNYTAPGDTTGRSLYFASEEQFRLGMRVTDSDEVIFFRLDSGEVIDRRFISPDQDAAVSAFAAGGAEKQAIGVGYADGSAQIVRHVYEVTYPQSVQNPDTDKVEKVITPSLKYPIGDQPIMLDETGSPIVKLAVQADDDKSSLLALTESGSLKLVHVTRDVNLLSKEVTIDRVESQLPLRQRNISHLLINERHREVFVASKDGSITYYDVSNKSQPVLIDKVQAVPANVEIRSLEFLSGSISILVGDSSGRITQWFPVRDDKGNYDLTEIRHFKNQSAPITAIAPEQNRKGFAAGDADGYVGIYHTTAHQNVALKKIADRPIEHLSFSPRNNGLLAQAENGELQILQVHNPHPEVSMQSLWGDVWYESRQQPEYIWQSSSASSDFEPKFSLTPLAFGTLKAAFYAMLFSIPLAILGAMYTAYFMSSRMRQVVKPAIEIMEALPTVILGFLAGLWFAPFVEKHLPGMFCLLIFIPLSVLLAAYLWRHTLPESWRNRMPPGWEAALLVPVIIIAAWFAITISQPLEVLLFDGNMPLWLTTELGIPYEQRNSMVVGIAMGFAVIPTIFSISEDAIYSVPKHLTTGSLALGATSWQTMVYVVLLTASPGIFSAVMIGLGRAVGETMIVVMATGNTAVMDLNIFQGFRALSANIAVEMPETEVASTHYRILFLAGLVLFLATFAVNTIAEIVRQRLRNKYSTI